MLYENVNIEITEDHIRLTYIAYPEIPSESKKSGLVYKRKEDQSVEDFRKDALKLLCEHLLLITKPEDFENLIKASIPSE